MFLPLALLISLPSQDIDVVYSRVGGTELKMDIYRPEGATRPAPAVLIIHGGAWMFGTRKDVTHVAKYAAQQGFVAATVQYRLAPTHKWPAMLDDVQTAVRFLRANAAKYNIDPNRIGSAGASAGGHLALFLGSRETRAAEPKEYASYSSRTQAVLNLFGPTDMSTFPKHPLLDQLYESVLGKPRKDAAKEITEASPINFVDRTTAPVFIIHGTLDYLVPLAQSKTLEKKLREAGVPVSAQYVEGMGHELPLEKPAVRKAFEQGVAWLEKYLGPVEKLRKAG